MGVKGEGGGGAEMGMQVMEWAREPTGGRGCNGWVTPLLLMDLFITITCTRMES